MAPQQLTQALIVAGEFRVVGGGIDVTALLPQDTGQRVRRPPSGRIRGAELAGEELRQQPVHPEACLLPIQGDEQVVLRGQPAQPLG